MPLEVGLTRTILRVALVTVGALSGGRGDAVLRPNQSAQQGPTTSTLLVVNSTCSQSNCDTLEIRAVVTTFVVPGQPPAGFMYLGQITSDSACFAFPAKDSLRVSHVDSVGDVLSSSWLYWTPDDALDVMAAHDALSPIGGEIEVVPADADGWLVSLPAAEGSAAVPAPRCDP